MHVDLQAYFCMYLGIQVTSAPGLEPLLEHTSSITDAVHRGLCKVHELGNTKVKPKVGPKAQEL